jgi:NADPH:quinone reductase-like Zn-dependent oxidoreductase
MAIPTKQTALLANEDGSVRLSTDVAVTSLEDHMVLVKTHAVGLNPIDTKMKGPLAAPGTIAGMDFAGKVMAVGPHAATPGSVQVGDRVCGAVIGYSKPKPTVGAFAEVVGAEDIGLMRLPADWSYEQGATLGCAVSTIGLALFRSLNVPGTLDSPTDKPVDVLVYGGSTATGTMAIQLLTL